MGPKRIPIYSQETCDLKTLAHKIFRIVLPKTKEVSPYRSSQKSHCCFQYHLLLANLFIVQSNS